MANTKPGNPPVLGGTETIDRYWLSVAHYWAAFSTDLATRVGAVLVDPAGRCIGRNWNRFPPKIADTSARQTDRDLKLRLTVHAEMGAILNAARAGTRTEGATIYLAATDDSRLIWGGPPCTRCLVEILAAGITTIVSYPVKPVPSKWHEDLKFAESLIAESGVAYREYPIS